MEASGHVTVKDMGQWSAVLWVRVEKTFAKRAIHAWGHVLQLWIAITWNLKFSKKKTLIRLPGLALGTALALYTLSVLKKHRWHVTFIHFSVIPTQPSHRSSHHTPPFGGYDEPRPATRPPPPPLSAPLRSGPAQPRRGGGLGRRSGGRRRRRRRRAGPPAAAAATTTAAMMLVCFQWVWGGGGGEPLSRPARGRKQRARQAAERGRRGDGDAAATGIGARGGAPAPPRLEGGLVLRGTGSGAAGVNGGGGCRGEGSGVIMASGVGRGGDPPLWEGA